MAGSPRLRFVQAVPPTHDREVPGLLDKGISGSRGDVLELEGGDLQLLHRGAGVREAEQLPFRGLQQQGEDPEEGLLRPIQLRTPQEADIPHLRQKRPQEMKEIPKTNRPQEKLENHYK